MLRARQTERRGIAINQCALNWPTSERAPNELARSATPTLWRPCFFSSPLGPLLKLATPADPKERPLGVAKAAATEQGRRPLGLGPNVSV